MKAVDGSFLTTVTELRVTELRVMEPHVMEPHVMEPWLSFIIDILGSKGR